MLDGNASLPSFGLHEKAGVGSCTARMAHTSIY